MPAAHTPSTFRARRMSASAGTISTGYVNDPVLPGARVRDAANGEPLGLIRLRTESLATPAPNPDLAVRIPRRTRTGLCRRSDAPIRPTRRCGRQGRNDASLPLGKDRSPPVPSSGRRQDRRPATADDARHVRALPSSSRHAYSCSPRGCCCAHAEWSTRRLHAHVAADLYAGWRR